ncbi:MAG: methylmalonyl-CoA mutase [Alphaproteobacteria bacterium]|nr:MAG: methylmalonyl-CoA mutase [Alphaproteobacteria bacterium]|tara:strand:- start:989 stop:3142 length:2154 start_codon:yes stop_codon:yes gene_type:complete
MSSNSYRTIKEWVNLAKNELKGKDIDTLVWKTPEGIDIQPLYTKNDLEGLSHLGGLPGFEPFLRGPKATMYAGRPWTIRQYAGFSTAKESNEFYKRNLAAGQMGLSVAFDLATHRGYDSDHPRVSGDVGMSGVAIDSVEDMKLLFDQIPLNKMSVSMTMNGAVLPVLANFVVAAEEQGVKAEELRGTIQNDILKEFMVRNTYIYPPAHSMRIVSDIISYTAEKMPLYNSISISGYHMQEAGANQVQELAFTIADGLEYVRAAINKGLKVDDFAPRLSFFFAIGMNFFMEIAKLRAARWLWANLMKKYFNPQNTKSLMLRTHCQTSGVSLTEQDPYNNIVRTTVEAMAAVLGGTQSLHTNAFDEAVALPTDFSARIARNTQLILQEETGITKSVDPLAGSYYIEALTGRLIASAEKIINDIEKIGGMTKAVEQGLPKQMIEESAAKRQAAVDSSESIVVGVNKYQSKSDSKFDVLKVNNEQVREEQIKNLKVLRSKRDNIAVNEALGKLSNGAKNNKYNLLQLSIEASRKRATVGEISYALEKVFDRHKAEYKGVAGIYGTELSRNENFIYVKQAINDFISKRSRKPKILIVKLGQDGHDRGANVVASAYEDLGFDVKVGPLFQTPKESSDVVESFQPDVVGASSLAGGHLTLIPSMIKEIRKNGNKNVVIIAGGVIPQEDYLELEKAGVDAIFGPGTNITDAARRVLGLIEQRPNMK